LEGKAAHLYELTCVIVLFPVLICFGTTATERHPQVGNILGDASYALYAVHFPLLAVLRYVMTIMHVHHEKILPLCFAAFLLPFAWWLGQMDTVFRRWLLTRSTAGRGASARLSPERTQSLRHAMLGSEETQRVVHGETVGQRDTTAW
jgi:peptidoglycan/LPS O-acetylase OafA/YrhL